MKTFTFAFTFCVLSARFVDRGVQLGALAAGRSLLWHVRCGVHAACCLATPAKHTGGWVNVGFVIRARDVCTSVDVQVGKQVLLPLHGASQLVEPSTAMKAKKSIPKPSASKELTFSRCVNTWWSSCLSSCYIISQEAFVSTGIIWSADSVLVISGKTFYNKSDWALIQIFPGIFLWSLRDLQIKCLSHWLVFAEIGWKERLGLFQAVNWSSALKKLWLSSCLEIPNGTPISDYFLVSGMAIRPENSAL